MTGHIGMAEGQVPNAKADSDSTMCMTLKLAAISLSTNAYFPGVLADAARYKVAWRAAGS